jgi:hypothetical protein
VPVVAPFAPGEMAVGRAGFVPEPVFAWLGGAQPPAQQPDGHSQPGS